MLFLFHVNVERRTVCVLTLLHVNLERTHLGMLGGARLGRLGTWGLSAVLLKGPRGPGRLGGSGAPRAAGRWPDDILLGAVGLAGGDLEKGKGAVFSSFVNCHSETEQMPWK